MPYTDEQTQIETRVLEALQALTRKDVSKWPALFEEAGVQEFPFAPEGSPGRIEGRSAIAAYLKDYPEKFDLHRIGQPIWHHDGNTAIVEFTVEGVAVPTGRPYHQRYVSVIEHRHGQITRYVDYWNPQVVADALGGMFK
jgi:ketosteroid isomerase-like protein